MEKKLWHYGQKYAPTKKNYGAIPITIEFAKEHTWYITKKQEAHGPHR